MPGFVYTNTWTGQTVHCDDEDPFFESEATWERSDSTGEFTPTPAAPPAALVKADNQDPEEAPQGTTAPEPEPAPPAEPEPVVNDDAPAPAKTAAQKKAAAAKKSTE